ncbi:MAG: TonB-dependent receptor [Bryobacterales bacterium]|nr:TonB-dependent receptor [Bryobacterales bacterium]
MRLSTSRGALSFVGVLLTICLPAFSQLNLGRIYGVVTDQSGAVVPGAMVTITDVARGVSRTLITDTGGEYSAPSLVPGNYNIRAAATGFNVFQRQDVGVGVGQDVRIDLSLQTGNQSQEVVVTGTPPIINTTSAMISTTIETKTLEDLPLNGRLFTKLLDFTPGVTGHPGGNTPNYSSNGAGLMTNVWMLDGVDDMNQFAMSGPLFGATTSADELTILPLDSIQEVNVSANPRADYGWGQGAVVNVGLKSGTNTLHGSAYAYGRYTGWDARSPYLNNGGDLPKADDLFKQFGASIGGAIIKDKLFYFGNYEGFRYTVGAPGILSIPSSLSLGGDPANSFPDAIADLKANGVQPNQLSLNLAGCTAAGACDPTKGIFTNGTSSFLKSSGLDNIGHSDNALEKIDYHFNDKNSIYGEYLLGNATDQTAGVGLQPYWANIDHNRVMVVRGVWVYVPNSSWVNEARFGYDRYNLQDYNGECTQNLGQPDYLKAFGFASGINAPSPECGFPIINIGNFAATGAGQFIQDQLVFQNTYHFIDSVSWTHGRHLIKFGGEFHHTLYRGYGAPNYLDGQVQFNGGLAFGTSTALEDFLAGDPASGQFLLNPPLTQTGFNRYAAFFQDDWRISRKLTLNLGLRYEYEPPQIDSHNSWGNFDPNSPTGLVQQTNSNPLYSTDKRDFGPRVGFAWDVTGKGTTVIRAGTSVIYDTIPMDALVTFQGASLPTIPTGFTLYRADGTTIQGPGNILAGTPQLGPGQLNWVYNAPGAPVVPVFNTTASALTCGNGIGSNPAPCSLLAKNPKSPRSYMTTWTVGVQHAFTNNLSVNVAYVGTHADELPSYVNVNQPALGTPGNIDPVGQQERRPYYNKFPYFSNIWQYSDVGWSNYRALQASLVERNTHGLTYGVSYTLQNGMTTQSGEGDNFAYLKDSTNISSSYAPMNSTPFQHFGLTLTYDIPGKKGFGQLLEGWSINTALNILSGTGVDLTDPLFDFAGIGGTIPFQGSYWNLYGHASDFSKVFGRTTPVPFFPGGSTPAACNSAAAAEPTNPSAPGSSGLASLASFGCYMVGSSVIVPPAFGTIGNMFRNEITGPAFREWDLSIAKQWRFFERLTAQYRAEFFNLTNSRNYGPANFPDGDPLVSGSFGVSSGPVNAGNAVNGTGDSRRIQMGLRFTF